MTIGYTIGIPDANHNPSTDQPDMKVNNDNNSTIWGVDHVTFGVATAPNGTHKQVTFSSNNVPAVPTSPPVMFTNTVSGLPQLFFYSGDAIHGQNQYVNAANGSTFLLGGIILKWGTYALGAGGPTQTATIPVAFPNNFYTVMVISTTGVNTYIIQASPVTLNTFNVRKSSTNQATIAYIAIGN